MRTVFAALAVCTLITACTKTPIFENHSSPGSALRAMDENQKLKDFDVLVDSFREYYGPLEYKERRFQFKLDDLAAEYRQKMKETKTDLEAYGVIVQFVTRFQDGHVGAMSAFFRESSYATPVRLAPFGDKALIVEIADPTLGQKLGIAVGDEVLTVDGKSPFAYLPIITKYVSFANPKSTRHALQNVLRRPAYMTELAPTKSTVDLKIERADGTLIERTLTWEKKTESSYLEKPLVTQPGNNVLYAQNAAEIIRGTLVNFGLETPFFMTPQVKAQFRPIQIKPSAEALAKHGVTDPKKVPDLFAAMYKYEGKTLLILRLSTYLVADRTERIAWFKALLEEYVALTDVIVIDQTHNPGGDMSYAMDFLALFADQKTKAIMNFLNGDRKWLEQLGTALKMGGEARKDNQELFKAGETAFKLVEEAYDNGGGLTKEPISLTEFPYINPKYSVEGRPVLVLINELAGSCGDIFPKLMQTNKLGTLFGQTTMGLGGNVEEVVTLPFSQIKVNMTRGLFAPYSPEGHYPESEMIENNGVRPDIEHEITANDFRKGYTEYVEAFSKAAIRLIK